MTVENIGRLKALSESLRIDAEIEQNGALQVCNTREIAEEGRRYVEKARGAGFPCEFWKKERVAETIGTKVYEGALFDPNSGQMHPGRLVRLFKAAESSSAYPLLLLHVNHRRALENFHFHRHGKPWRRGCVLGGFEAAVKGRRNSSLQLRCSPEQGLIPKN